MRVPIRLGSAMAIAAAGLAAAIAVPFAAAGPAFASTASPASPGRAPAEPARPCSCRPTTPAGNQVVAYHRAPDGVLSHAGTYATGGLGGILAGSAVDHLASQGSLSYDQQHALLYAVNAGSDTISVFAVSGDRLALRQVLGSGGSFPVSVAVHGDVVYVAERAGRRPGAGLPGLRQLPGPDPRIRPRAGPGPHGQPAVHQHAGAGRVHSGRPPAHRDHQGQRE